MISQLLVGRESNVIPRDTFKYQILLSSILLSIKYYTKRIWQIDCYVFSIESLNTSW